MSTEDAEYDPFVRGRCPVGVRTIHAHDPSRDRRFPCEVWYPAAAPYAGQDLSSATQDVFTVASSKRPVTQMAVRDATAEPGTCPLIVFSHLSLGGRRASSFLCTHLSSHGYVVAALDHSEVVAPELARKEGETQEQKAARLEAVIAARVPDIRILLDRLLDGAAWAPELSLDSSRIGIVGHSFGGWTALAANETESRIRAVVALAPAGASRPKPGILPAKLTFTWGRAVPTLYVVAENDAWLPLAGMHEIFDRAPEPKHMVIVRRADHLHFVDLVEELHETARTTPPSTAELAWVPKDMRPIAELCSGEDAHRCVRGLTLCHMDAVLRQREEAQRFFRRDVEAELAGRGVSVIVRKHEGSMR